MPLSLKERVRGSIIGAAVGDALGAPMECLHYKEAYRLYGNIRRFEDITPEMLAAFCQAVGWEFNDKVLDMVGRITDDTVLADLLMDCIIRTNGQVTAHAFADEWLKFDEPVPNPDGGEIRRLERVHWIEKIPYYRNKLRDIPKRELGHGEQNATNAIMFISPVGVLCAGDPLMAELMAADVTSVNQHGRPRDAAGGYAAAVAACFLPNASVEQIVETAIAHIGDEKETYEVKAMVALAHTCRTTREFAEKYYQEIIGHVVPYQDWQHLGKKNCNTWFSSEILGVTLANFLITKGNDARDMMLASALIGRDADTIARCAGGLIGAYRGLSAIPPEWVSFVLQRNRWAHLEEKSDCLTAIILQRLKTQAAQAQSILQPDQV
jgi:ADP-ribosylglycohydrolase